VASGVVHTAVGFGFRDSELLNFPSLALSAKEFAEECGSDIEDIGCVKISAESF
jgi:hypothetical protein